MAWTSTYPIRFADVDYAQILYYPNFLHYFHTAFEDFFEEACHFPYHRLLREHRVGYPSVHVEVDFREPLRFGDHVAIRIAVEKIGTKSVTWSYRGKRVETDQLCVEGRIVTACMSLDSYRGIAIPSQHRAWFEEHHEKNDPIHES